MVEVPEEKITSPAGYLGNFEGFIQRVGKDLEAFFGDDAGDFETVAERAEAIAPFIAAQRWLVERWGDDFPCPVCSNVEWTVSGIQPSTHPNGYLHFHVSCTYCGNTMRVIPGVAELNEPHVPQQLHFPDQ